jgi:6-pyruvoyltetrahydropterin/6-carboxytetrahydropterin synthase
MYTLAVRRDFIARHFLIGGDWGPENLPNSHQYVLELQLEGSSLDRHGYLVDIVQVDAILNQLEDYYREKMLNDLPEFAGLNPSLEHFARILSVSISERLPAANIGQVKVVLWENAVAWASHVVDRRSG